MRKFLCTIIFLLLGIVYTYSQTTLSFRYANPRIVYTENDNADNGNGLECVNLKWDVEMKASAAGTKYFFIQIIQNFNAAALADFIYIPGPLGATSLSSRYVVTSNTNSGNLNLFVTSTESPTSTASSRFMTIPTTYTLVGTFMCRISDPSALAGIKFIQASMNGQESEKTFSPAGIQNYANPNIFEGIDLTNLNLGRIYSSGSSWSQYGGTTLDTPFLDWNTPVNTSVWDGTPTITGAPVFKASSLRVHNGATLTIQPAGKLTVSGNTDVLTPNGLILQSDATGTGSLIINNNGIPTGTAVAQRWITTGKWSNVSSPLSGQSVAQFLSTNPNIATASGNSNRGMMDYDPTNNVWHSFFTDGAANGNLDLGRGFSMRVGASSAAINFNGSLQVGNLSATGLTPEKWNCIGNPYTSAIGMNDLSSSGSTNNFLKVNAANLDQNNGAIYVWEDMDDSNGKDGKYKTYSNAVAGLDLQQGQAFLIKMNTSATTINFTPAMQIHSPATALKTKSDPWPTINLMASVGDKKSSTIVAFNSAMTKGLDATYDAGLLKASSDLLVYSKLVEGNGTPFAIQALPDNESNMIIPIGLDFKTGGQVIFSSVLMNLPTDSKVVLEDMLNKTYTDLSKENYKVNIEANSSIADRFYLHTTIAGKMVKEPLKSTLNAYAIGKTEIRIIGDVSNKATATLYDVHGRVVVVKTLEEASLNTIPLPDIKIGVYMLSVNDNGKLSGFKILIREQ